MLENDMDLGAYTLEQILEDIQFQEDMRHAKATHQLFKYFEQSGFDFRTVCELTVRLMTKRNEQ